MLVAISLMLGAATVTTAAASAASPVANGVERPDGLVVSDGMTQPVYRAATVISERVWVETAVDTDGDGEHDRVVIDVDRPATGGRVASVLTASPYWDCCQDVANHPVDLKRLPQESATSTLTVQAAQARRSADDLRKRYVPRGYATVRAQTIGTADSDGCPTSGDHNETLSVTAVIDWLAGRGRGFDKSGQPVTATWSTGKVGMVGTSYNGTLAQQAATTGVEGLVTIVPTSAISSWYDYYRANGLVVAPGGYQGEDADVLARAVVSDRQKKVCEPVFTAMERDQDRVTGDWNRFWRDRDYVGSADRITASVFVVHGLNDWNVKTQHVEQFWNVLARNHVPRKIWWHQGGHGGPTDDGDYVLPNKRRSTFDDTVNRWLDHWLYGVANGIEKEPRAIVQQKNGAYRTYRDWPDPRVRNQGYSLAAMGGNRTRMSFVDEGARRTAEKLVTAPARTNPHRLAFRTAKLTGEKQISGSARVSLTMSVGNRKAANITALLVDYAPNGKATIVSRGWTDPQNHASLRHGEPLKKGRFYRLRFGLQPHDYTFAPGHRIGLVVISTDHDYTLRPAPGTRLTLIPGASRLRLPVVS